MDNSVFVITSPDSVGTSIISVLEATGRSVVHSLFNWKNEKGQEAFAQLRARERVGEAPADYVALEACEFVVADLECNPALLAEYMSLAVYFGKPILGTFEANPTPTKFSSWCEAIVPHGRLVSYLSRRKVCLPVDVAAKVALLVAGLDMKEVDDCKTVTDAVLGCEVARGRLSEAIGEEASAIWSGKVVQLFDGLIVYQPPGVTYDLQR